jgi:hypothetical protein
MNNTWKLKAENAPVFSAFSVFPVCLWALGKSLDPGFEIGMGGDDDGFHSVRSR